ncbi:hypothetical protein [Leadbettera azotonutricia]|uniref:Uncharacterized protein n=1 Tax=Leadbettera azotonutricia (strain ATCC BAA-888 / DSM 13862 / ZAS-9) TaxID=545695 RepID=F5Y7C6_LEAAZ|nr:hypothetical protein [Leadbettera azotonutricia]AEF80205.1 hypothetical protein TREAZ_3507 [Leadbettera azotonutricia ZAS-9]
MYPRHLLAVLIFSLFAFGLFPQSFDEIPSVDLLGDPAQAEKYAGWAEKAIAEGRWAEALAVLERAADYSDVSLDLCYLLAKARSHFNQSRGAVLEALGKALKAKGRQRYSPDDVRLMAAENFIALRRYGEALNILDALPDSYEKARLRLLSLRFLPSIEEFHRSVASALDRYPRESGPARIFFSYLQAKNAAGQQSGGRDSFAGDQELLELIVRRLPVLIPLDPELAWMAAPFLRDIEDARRKVQAYRAVNVPVPASLPVSLNMGVIDEETALEELFQYRDSGHKTIDKALLEDIYRLLRDEIRRRLFRRNLLEWSGVITEDADGDSIAEASALYRRGQLVAYSYDADQDGLPELSLEFEAGDPRSAQLPVSDDDRRMITVQWEEYPSVLEARLGDERYIPRPLDFYFSPVKFTEITGSDLLFPVSDPTARLTRRTLVSFALKVERPSQEFSGGMEVVELSRSIPIRAREYLDGLMVSETDFLRGRPLAQRVDLDLDGRLETVRHFRRSPVPATTLPGSPDPSDLNDPLILLDYSREIDYADSDWDGDGVYETHEPIG